MKTIKEYYQTIIEKSVLTEYKDQLSFRIWDAYFVVPVLGMMIYWVSIGLIKGTTSNEDASFF